LQTEVAVFFFFFLQGKAPKEIHAILTETLGDGQRSDFFEWLAKVRATG
jgi:hypothetical protein